MINAAVRVSIFSLGFCLAMLSPQLTLGQQAAPPAPPAPTHGAAPAPAEVAGILNLRGRVVTAIDMRSRLDFGARAPDRPVMAIGIEFKGESYGLLVDAVGEVIPLAVSERQANPSNLDPRLARVAAGVYRLEGQLLVELDVDCVLDIRSSAVAA